MHCRSNHHHCCHCHSYYVHHPHHHSQDLWAQIILANPIISFKVCIAFIFGIKHSFDLILTYYFCAKVVNQDNRLQDKPPLVTFRMQAFLAEEMNPAFFAYPTH
jgi:hypothetical protein